MTRAHATGLAGLGSATLIAAAICAGPAVAAPLSVRSGEHAEFTRLVLEPPAGTGWKVGRTAEGYELRLEAPGVDFDTDRVFDLIPATRIAGIGPGTVPSSLAVTLGCDCHAVAFMSGRALVLDVMDGPAPTGSPFEVPFEPASEAEPPGVSLLPLVEPEGPAPPDPWIDTYWALSPTLSMGPRLSGPRRQISKQGGNPDLPVHAGSAGPGTATNVEAQRQGEQGNTKPAPSKEPSGGRVAEAPSAAAPPHDKEGQRSGTKEREAPAEAIGRAESELARQFARAASQGLLKPSQAASDGGPNPVGNEPNPDPEVGDVPAAKVEPDDVIVGLFPETANLAIRAETSVDRDTLMSIPSKRTRSGDVCPPDELFDVGAWTGDGPPATEIAAARASLSGEFDMPDTGQAVALAKLYIALSFGAEARQILDTFDVVESEAPYLRALAAILEGESLSPSLADLAGCGGKSALWVALAAPQDKNSRFDGRAAARHLSSLPPHLRRLLGPPLAERLLVAGELPLAESVTEAIGRLPGPHGAAFDLVSARLDLERRKIEPALADLAEAIGTNDPEAPEAVAVAIETALGHGRPVDPAVVDTAAALAFELRGSSAGLRLASAHTRAIAAEGDLSAAFAALDLHRADAPDADFRPVLRELADRLATVPDDGEFAELYFRRRPDIAAAEAGLSERRALGRRLAQLGFSGEVAALLGVDGRADRAGRLILAAAALHDLRPETALAALQGLDGPDAADLRDRVNGLLDPPGPGTGPATTADPVGVPGSADTAGGSFKAEVPQGPLAEGRRLLEQSRAARERILDALSGAVAPGNG